MYLQNQSYQACATRSVNGIDPTRPDLPTPGSLFGPRSMSRHKPDSYCTQVDVLSSSLTAYHTVCTTSNAVEAETSRKNGSVTPKNIFLFVFNFKKYMYRMKVSKKNI